jgi:hypothetical protein
MNTLHRFTFAVCLTLPLTVLAQSINNDAPRPPELEVLEEGTPPTISNKGAAPNNATNQIENIELPDGTRETKVKAGPSTYYVVPGTDGNGDPVTRTQWKIKEFESAGSKPKD